MKLIFNITFLIISSVCTSQIGEVFDLARNNQIAASLTKVLDLNLTNDEKNQILIHIDYIEQGYSNRDHIKVEKNASDLAVFLDMLNKGNSLYYKEGNPTMARIKYDEAIEYAEKNSRKDWVAEASIAAIVMFNYFYNQMGSSTYEIYLDKLNSSSTNIVHQGYYYLFSYRFKQRDNLKKKISSDKVYSRTRAFFNKNPKILSGIKEAFFAYHFIIDSTEIDSGRYFLNSAITRLSKPQSLLEKERYVTSFLNLGALEMDFGDPKKSLSYIERSKDIKFKFRIKQDIDTYYYFWKYEALKKLKSADSIFYKALYFENEARLSIAENNMTIANLSEIHKTNLLRFEKNRLKWLLIIGGISISLFSYLVYRNTKKKQRIAEQEKELEMQKTTTLLKEQEINTINAIIEGQEKERTRLASELHDNLGGTLAAVKMHIGNLQTNLQTTQYPEELLEKANTLISAAYKDVRNIAHARNSGVMAKDGLLPAVQKLARTLSNKDTLTIEVQDYGLTKRLNNDLEITIFRIIQELVTNIVKHANASQASISLTQHQEELSIIVEDNGVGFIAKKLEVKNGMGLGSIERRVEHLEGSMEVDSTPGRGTNILIDIPL